MFYKGILSACVWLILFGSPAFSQNSIPLGSEIPGNSFPTAPSSRILDQVGVLDGDLEKKEEISKRLKDLYEAHNLPVYLVLYSSLVSDSAGNYPRDLYDAWIGENNDGVLAVVEVDSRRVDLLFPQSAQDTRLHRSVGVTRVPDHLQAPLIASIRQATKEASSQMAHVDLMSEVLVRELDLYLSGSGRSSGNSRFIIITLVIGLIIGLLGYCCHLYTRRAETHHHEQIFLPDVEVEARLGAPYGGGRVNTITYRAHREAEAERDP